MYKTVKHNQSNGGCECKLYLFPDISAEGAPDRGKEKRRECRFSPLQFQDETDSSCAKLVAQTGGPIDMGKQEAMDVERQTYLKGFAEGEKNGRDSEKTRLEPVLNFFSQALRELEQLKTGLYRNFEKEVLELALAISKKVIFHEVNVNEQVVISVIKEALQKVVNQDNVRIKVNPADLEYVKNAESQFLATIGTVKNLIVVEDESVLRGGCLIETDFGDIDARIERQLQVIEEALTTEFERIWIKD